MSQSRIERSSKKQLGQFMTPIDLATAIVNSENINENSKILEPSFGDGSFIMPIIDKLINQGLSLDIILTQILWGVELDKNLYQKTIDKIITKYGSIPQNHNLILGDFFEVNFDVKFTNIIGNPPFGGTIDYRYQNKLENIYGKRNGLKIKKETYSFFKIKCIENLSVGGKLTFICSDTFLSIKTMNGLRYFLQKSGFTKIQRLSSFSEETNYPMVIINFEKDKYENFIYIDDTKLLFSTINLTPNNSWSMDLSYAKYFKGSSLSNWITASGGLSTGKNEYFVREIKDGNLVEETYSFEYFQDRITLDNELRKAKLNKLSDKKKSEIINQEKNGFCVENVRITAIEPHTIQLPSSDYSYYNKATNDIFYSEPKSVIYWKDNGKAVLTFKKNSNWYLHGIGGQNFYKKEGLTWQLISKRINPRYLPEGYILDNSAPVAILKPGVDKEELYFIIGWLATDLATQIQKKVINHTKNIQNKDIERLPYPFWVDKEKKEEIIKIVKKTIDEKISRRGIETKSVLKQLNQLFIYE